MIIYVLYLTAITSYVRRQPFWWLTFGHTL